MANKSDPPPSSIDSDDDESEESTHPEHDDILDQSIVIWRMIAELAGVTPNGEAGADAVELLMTTFYEQRREALLYAAKLLSDISDEESRDADSCRNGEECSVEKIAMLRERAAALKMVGEMVFNHMQEMADGHVHFNADQAHRIKEIADELIGNGESKEKSN